MLLISSQIVPELGTEGAHGGRGVWWDLLVNHVNLHRLGFFDGLGRLRVEIERGGES